MVALQEAADRSWNEGREQFANLPDDPYLKEIKPEYRFHVWLFNETHGNQITTNEEWELYLQQLRDEEEE